MIIRVNGLKLTNSHWILRKLSTVYFIKNSSKDDIPLKRPDLKIKNPNIERNSLTKFLGVILWKVSTEIFLKTTYFSYIHSYLNYANIAWACANLTKINKIHLLQRRSALIVLNEDFKLKDNFSVSHTRPLLRKLETQYPKYFSEKYLSTSNIYP